MRILLTLLLIVGSSILAAGNDADTKVLERSREIGEDVYVLPTSSGDEIELESENETSTSIQEMRAEPFEVEVKKVSEDVQTYFDQHPKLFAILLGVLSAVLIIAVFFICRYLCFRRKRFTAIMQIPKMNDDLYDTTICSQRLDKTTLPDSKEVTMRLVSADNSMV